MPKDELTSFELRLKCQEILKNLPDVALLDAYEELSSISFWYAMSGLRVDSTSPASSIKGKLRATETRPPIVLEP